MMNQACAQCNKHLTDDAAMSADSDGLFGTLDAELEQAVSLFSKQHNGASAPLFCWHWVCNIKAAW
jgi:hypothetical protein